MCWWDIIPGCWDYTLQRIALDNVSSYSKQATNTILRNFYVDDVLKWVQSLRDALTLIQKVADLCKRGGFKLTKFISNKKDVLFQIPDALRRDGTKDKYLTGSIPIEKALGIFWDAENDVIKFKIDLKDQSLTRRGTLLSLVQYMILLSWHAYFCWKEEDFFKVGARSWMVGMKCFLTTSAKNGIHGKAVWRAWKKFA